MTQCKNEMTDSLNNNDGEDRPVLDVAYDDEEEEDSTCVNTDSSLLSSSRLGSISTTLNLETGPAAAATTEPAATTKVNPKTAVQRKRRKSCMKCGPTWTLIYGLLLTLLGVCSVIWTPFDVLMNERLKMRPGFPPFEWWKNPPDEVIFKVFIFNVTNADAFVNGTDAKLKLEEIGPIIYLEKLTHTNITFNDNGTLTYVASRTAIFLPERNTIDLNQTLILPNLAVLGIASYLADQSFIVKFGYNLMLRRVDAEPIIKTTIYNYMWNFTDPILDLVEKIVPFMVPTKNMGILQNVYSNFVDTLTVRIGTENGHDQFFMLDKYDGSEYLPNESPQTCSDVLTNATEGVMYPQYMSKNWTIKYWRKTLCRIGLLQFSREQEKFGLLGYRYELPNNSFDRVKDGHDCYASYPILPDGLSDASKCFYDFPVAASIPHFLIGDKSLGSYVDGMKPNNSLHGSYAIIEPTTGIPMESRARSQSNLIVRKLSGFTPKLDKFSDLIIPMFWIEYNQDSLPWYILGLLHLTVTITPIGQYIFIALCLIIGLGLTYKAICQRRTARTLKHVRRIAMLHFEKEKFIKNCNR